ncbi:MAG: hypothetical protein AAGF87_04135 [Bacteroidota bacterium]
MPDSKDNWAADDKFWDNAWADMESRLDKDSKTGFALWIPLFLLIFSLLGLMVWNAVSPIKDANNDREPIEVAEQSESINTPTTPPILAGNPTDQIQIDDQQSEPVTTIVPKPEIDPFQNTTDTYRSDSDWRRESASNTGPTTPESPSKVANEDIENSENDPSRSSVFKTSREDIVIRGMNRPAEVLDFHINYQMDQAPHTPIDLPHIQVEDDSNPPGSVGLRKVNFRIDALLSQGTSTPGLGYGLSLGSQFRLGGSWFAGAAFNLRREQLPLFLGDGGTENEAFSMEQQTGGQSQDLSPASLDQIGAELDRAQLNFGRFTFLGLDLRLGKFISNRWSIETGIGLQYVLEALGPEVSNGALASGTFQNLFTSGTDLLELDNSLENILNQSSSRLGEDVSLSYSPLQFELFAGTTVAFSSRWSAGFDLRFRPTRLYADNSDFRFGRLRGQLRLGYNF